MHAAPTAMQCAVLPTRLSSCGLAQFATVASKAALGKMSVSSTAVLRQLSAGQAGGRLRGTTILASPVLPSCRPQDAGAQVVIPMPDPQGGTSVTLMGCWCAGAVIRCGQLTAAEQQPSAGNLATHLGHRAVDCDL
jgi:hypothetical protein